MNKVHIVLIFVVIFAVLPLAHAEVSITIDSIIINDGLTNEVSNDTDYFGSGIGQTATIKVILKSSMASDSDVNATVGAYLIASNGTVLNPGGVFTNRTLFVPKGEENSTTFVWNINSTTTLPTDVYNVSIFVKYPKNATYNETIVNSSQTIKLVSIKIGRFYMRHANNTAKGDTAEFIQEVTNTGTTTATVEFEIYVFYDSNDDGDFDDPGDRIADLSTGGRFQLNPGETRSQRFIWQPQQDGCQYSNSSRWLVRSLGYYGYSYLNNIYTPNKAQYIYNLVVEYLKLDDEGVDFYELAPGDVVRGLVDVGNWGVTNAILHEAKGWVAYQNGTPIFDLVPIYINRTYLGNTTGCQTNKDNIDYERLTFSGNLPASLSPKENYKVVMAIDHGVPRSDYININEHPYDGFNDRAEVTFELVEANLTKIYSPAEIAKGVNPNITVEVENLGVNSIDGDPGGSPPKVNIKIYNSSFGYIWNKTDPMNLSAYEKKNHTFDWIPTATINLGTYKIDTWYEFGLSGTTNKSATINVIYIGIANISSASVAPYESTSTEITLRNHGPTNATVTNLSTSILTSPNVYLGSYENEVLTPFENRSFNFTFYFDPGKYSFANGTYSLKSNLSYGGTSTSYTGGSITLLPVGIKSFSLPSYGITNTSFNASVVLHNIAGSAVNVSLNLTVNGSSTNYTTVSVPANSTLTYNIPVNITSSGVYNITLYANYSSLPGRLSRSGVITIYDSGAELSISSGDITYSPSSPKQGDTVTISATVHNTGYIDADDVVVEFLLDSTSHANKTISIAANSSTTVNFTWSNAASGTHTVTINVDPLNAYGEKNESDNTASISVSVAAPTKPPSAVGGGGPGVEPAFEEGLNEVTTESLLQAVKEKRLENARFYYTEAPLLPVLAVLGYNPAPDSIKDKLTRVEPITGDVYTIAAELAVEKYIRLTYPNTVVVARGDLPVDAIAAIAYARSNRIPVLLTKPGELPEATLSAIEKFSPRRIIILGGKKAVSESVEEQLAKIAEVERIAGETRYDTAVKLAELARNYDTIVVTSGEAPGSDAVFLATAYRAPVVYVKDDEIPEVTADFLASHRVTPKFRPVKLLLVGVNASLKEQILGLILSPHLSGEVAVTVINEDDDRLYVEVIVGSMSRGEFISPGSSYTYKPFKLRPGEYKVKLRWLDPDKLEFNYLQSSVSVNPAERTEVTLKVPRITQ